MNDLIGRLSSEQLLIVILAMIGGIVMIVAILAFMKYSMQLLVCHREELEMQLRKKIIDHGIATGADMNALLAAEASSRKTSSSSEDLNAKLAKVLVMLEISPAEIENILELVSPLDPNRKKAIVSAIEEMQAEGAEAESILAAIRGLCVSTRTEEKVIDVPVPAV
jgi:hypothetical protein